MECGVNESRSAQSCVPFGSKPSSITTKPSDKLIEFPDYTIDWATSKNIKIVVHICSSLYLL